MDGERVQRRVTGMSNTPSIKQISLKLKERNRSIRNRRRLLLALIAVTAILPPYESPGADLTALRWLLIGLVALAVTYVLFNSEIARAIFYHSFRDRKKTTRIIVSR